MTKQNKIPYSTKAISGSNHFITVCSVNTVSIIACYIERVFPIATQKDFTPPSFPLSQKILQRRQRTFNIQVCFPIEQQATENKAHQYFVFQKKKKKH